MGVIVRRTTMMVVLTVAVALSAAGGAQAAFSGVGALGTGRYDNTTTLLDDGHLLVAGGTSNGPLDSARLYDPTQNTWADAAPLKIPREGATAVLLQSGKVLVAGGQTSAPDDPSTTYTHTAEVYDPDTNTWAQTTGDMHDGRFQPTMTVLADGRVLVAGGSGSVNGGPAASLDSAEIYNPDSNAFEPAASMSVPRAMHTATLLSSGDVLVAGGYDGKKELASAELYDPKTNTWSTTGSLTSARDSATATMLPAEVTKLPNDEVLVAGGDGGSVGGAPAVALKSAELYDPGDGTWHAAADMAGARQAAAAALLKDGTVLVTGGKDARQGSALTTTERYDPGADKWSDAGPLTTARQGHTLTALADGRAVVVGGNSADFAPGLASVERYSPVSMTVTVPSFGSHAVGTPSDVVHAVVKNTGTAPLVVSGVSLSGHDDFAIDSENCSAAPVAVDGSCDVGLVFTPKAGGQRSATLALADNTAAGTTTIPLNGIGIGPATADPGGATPPATGATGGSGQAGSTSPTPRQEIKGAKAGSTARATCSVRNARSHGRTRSTVTCRMTWPTRSAVALNAKLMRGRTVLMSSRTTARSGQAKITMRLNRRLSSGRYTVAITRRDGTAVMRQALRVS